MLDLSPDDARRLLAKVLRREPLAREVTVALDLMEQLVRRLVRTGEIQAAVMPDGSLRVDVAELSRWLEKPPEVIDAKDTDDQSTR